jgi:HKD family nuclease
MLFINQPSHLRAGDWILDHISEVAYTRLQAAVAFVQYSGVARIETPLRNFLESGRTARFVVGIDGNGTSEEGLRSLLSVVADRGEIWVLHNPNQRETPIFHPKVFIFEAPKHSDALIGSSNLTKGGMFTNYEAAIALTLQHRKPSENALRMELQTTFDEWCSPSDVCRRLDSALLSQLVKIGLVRSATADATRRSRKAGMGGGSLPGQLLFQGKHVPPAPSIPRGRAARAEAMEPVEAESDLPATAKASDMAISSWFGLTVLPVDLHVQGSSPEITITKGIRDQMPTFWGWPAKFSFDKKTGQSTRRVTLEFEGKTLEAYLKDFPGRKPGGTKASADFRIGSIAPIVRALREVGDMVVFEAIPNSKTDYRVRVVLKEHADYIKLVNGFTPHKRARSGLRGTYKTFKYVVPKGYRTK